MQFRKKKVNNNKLTRARKEVTRYCDSLTGRERGVNAKARGKGWRKPEIWAHSDSGVLCFEVDLHWSIMANDFKFSHQFLLPLALCLICFASLAQSVWLNIPSSGTKCVSEEIQTNVVVLADYYVVADQLEGHHIPTVSARVFSFLFFFSFSQLCYLFNYLAYKFTYFSGKLEID